MAKLLGNVAWQVGDKVLRLGVGLLITVKIARYLGPDQFGKWSYAIAFATLFGSFATLGLDNIVVRELVHSPTNKSRILGTAFVLKLVASTVAILVVTAAIAILKPNDAQIQLLVLLSAAAFLFQASNIVDFYFQAEIRSKYSVVAQNAAFLLMAAVKLAMLLNHASLMQFAIVTLCEAALTAVFLFLAFFAQHNTVRHWQFEVKRALKLLIDGFPIILSGLAVALYYKIGLLMISQMRGDAATGIYSAATRISEAWYFVPIALTASVFPMFVERRKHSEQEYLVATQKFYNAIVLLALAVALITTLTSHWVISMLYGARYDGAASILVLHIWAGLFVCLGLASGSTLTIQGLQKYNFYRTLIGCLCNILLNFLLIPRFSGVGAAAATIFSYAASNFSIGLFRPGREIFFMMIKSLNVFQSLKRVFSESN